MIEHILFQLLAVWLIVVCIRLLHLVRAHAPAIKTAPHQSIWSLWSEVLFSAPRAHGLALIFLGSLISLRVTRNVSVPTG